MQGSKQVNDAIDKIKDPIVKSNYKFLFFVVLTCFGVIGYMYIAERKDHITDLTSSKEDTNKWQNMYLEAEKNHNKEKDSIINRYANTYREQTNEIRAIGTIDSVIQTNPIKLKTQIKKITQSIKQINPKR